MYSAISCRWGVCVQTCYIKPAEESAARTNITLPFICVVYKSEWIIYLCLKTQRSTWGKTLVPDNSSRQAWSCFQRVHRPMNSVKNCWWSHLDTQRKQFCSQQLFVYHKEIIWPYSGRAEFWSISPESLCVFKPWIWHDSCRHIFFHTKCLLLLLKKLWTVNQQQYKRGWVTVSVCM